MDTRIPGIYFDEKGVCNYCGMHDSMDHLFPVGKNKFENLVKQIKKDGRGREFDAVIGLSGGCDSSYLLAMMASLGVRLLAVHLDNGWNTETAEHNMMMVTDLNMVPLEKVKVNQDVFDSLCRSFLYASTPDADIPNDLALLEVMSQKALDHDVKYVLNGHSFRTEGSAPLGWTYMDGAYLEDVNQEFENKDLTGYPHLSWEKQVEFWDAGIKTVRPLYHLDYQKERAKDWLHRNYGWDWYGGLHAENIYTKFVGRYLWTYKFGIDYRLVEYSALVRSRQLDKKQALELMAEGVSFEFDYLLRILNRLGLSKDEFDAVMALPPRSYTDFDSYLSRFRDEDNKEFFKRLLSEDKIPLTFYKKYVEG